MIDPTLETHLLEEARINLPKNAKRQVQILGYFVDSPVAIEQGKLFAELQINRGHVKTLIDKGLIQEQKVEEYRNHYDDDTIKRISHLPFLEAIKNTIHSIKY